MSHYHVIVVGAGLIGATTALALAQQDKSLKVALIERQSPMNLPASTNQRVVALGSVARQLLETVGVFQKLDQGTAYPYTRMRVWDENSHGELYFDAQQLHLQELGHMVDAIVCTRALQQQALDGLHSNLDVFFDCELQRLVVDDHGARIESDHVVHNAQLIIGADGAGSWVRQQAKIFSQRYSYGQTGIVANVKTAESHQDCAWQRFLQSGPVAILPLKDNRASIVWSAPDEMANTLMSKKDDEFARELARALQMRLGEVESVGQRYAFALQSQRADTYYSKRVALIGDAAHSIHPLAGQGANLGFKDVKAILQSVQTAKNGDYASLGHLPWLQRYERMRKPDNEQTDTLMSVLNSAYQWQMPAWLQLRGVGMNVIDRSQPLKALLVEHAVG